MMQKVLESILCEEKPRLDKATQIFGIVKDLCSSVASKKARMDILEKKVLAKGFTSTDLE